jgi:hypothetical protein
MPLKRTDQCVSIRKIVMRLVSFLISARCAGGTRRNPVACQDALAQPPMNTSLLLLFFRKEDLL